jgi:tRNA(Ile)-lysidine synthase
MDSSRRPRLTPAIADVRRAVRAALPTTSRVELVETAPLVLVALSGGPDSLALAAATAFEASRAGIRAGAVVVDHGLQLGSADVAARAADQARSLGLDPVLVRTVSVAAKGGPEAAARMARYAALDEAATEAGAVLVLLGHTLDDQAETVLLGLARGSGPASLHGMSPSTSSGSGLVYARPLLDIRRASTVQFCVDSGLEPWIDPQNADPSFARVRVRETVLPLLERELGPGIAEALARTAGHLREDSDALDHFAEELAEELAELAESGISLPVRALASNPPALRQRLIRLAVESEFHVSLSRAQTLEVARLVTHWHGQKALDLPGVRVERRGSLLIFSANG